MGQLNNPPSEPLRDPLDTSGVGTPQTEQTLQAMSQELKRLHQDLIVQFAQDIARLQAEKSHLIEDIERLRRQHQELQSEGSEVLAQRQRLRQQLYMAENHATPRLSGDRVTSSLDATGAGRSLPQSKVNSPSEPSSGSGSEPPSAQAAQEPPTVPPKAKSSPEKGLLFVLLSSFALSFHNVVVKILFRAQDVIGLGQLGGVLTPGLGNSLLILWIRMLIVVPLLAVLATRFYAPTWLDVKRLLLARDRRLLWNVVGSGALLFVSQVLIYLALGQIAAGIAITLFFIYPTVTILLDWRISGNRPSLFKILVMVVICVGGILALPQATGPATGNLALGSFAAAASGFAFAGFVTLTGVCAGKLHPVPISLMQFVTIFVLSSLVLMFPGENLSVNIQPEMWPSFLIGCLVLGAATLLGYLCNNIGIGLIGAGPASIISATGPAFTAVLAWLMIQDQLQGLQWLGVLLVTLSVVGLNLKKMQEPPKPKAA